MQIEYFFTEMKDMEDQLTVLKSSVNYWLSHNDVLVISIDFKPPYVVIVYQQTSQIRVPAGMIPYIKK